MYHQYDILYRHFFTLLAVALLEYRISGRLLNSQSVCSLHLTLISSSYFLLLDNLVLNSSTIKGSISLNDQIPAEQLLIHPGVCKEKAISSHLFLIQSCESLQGVTFKNRPIVDFSGDRRFFIWSYYHLHCYSLPLQAGH